MRAKVMAVRAMAIGLGWIGVASTVGWCPPARGESNLRPDARRVVGKELFRREWVANDPRSHGGDGLGPVYNASSCLACHHLGGPGGAGPAENDVAILTPVARTAPGESPPPPRAFAELVRRETTLVDPTSVVFHKFGVRPEYKVWASSDKARGSGLHGVALTQTRRNTPALFGSGLIDAIPEALIDGQEAHGFAGFPEIQGRVARLDGGKVGRFGWKAQTATLEDFVLTACSVELGLEVHGHPQSLDPTAPAEGAPGDDLTGGECEALIAYVASLPAPGRRPPFDLARATSEAAGAQVFGSVGCATCHRPDLGEVSGLYSDLLLHDMGESLADLATYYGTPVSPGDNATIAQPLADASGAREIVRPATRQEWRTPPLWGIRDSAPYLHDGRARTLHDAINAHDGEARATVERYRRLSSVARMQLGSFLLSLSAPASGVERQPGAAHARKARPKAASANTFF